MTVELQPSIDKVWRNCENKGSRGRTVTLKVKFSDFEIITRSRSVPFAERPAGRTATRPADLTPTNLPRN